MVFLRRWAGFFLAATAKSGDGKLGLGRLKAAMGDLSTGYFSVLSAHGGIKAAMESPI